MKKIIFFTLIILSFVSCVNSEKRKNISSIDSLINVLDSTEAMFNKFDSAKAYAKYDDYKKTLTELAKYSGNLKNEDIRWQIMFKYDNINRPIRKGLPKFLLLRKEIILSRQQLNNLKHDYKKSIIDNKKFIEFYTDESKAINNLSTNIRLYTEEFNILLRRMDSLKPGIVKITNELSDKKPIVSDKIDNKID